MNPVSYGTLVPLLFALVANAQSGAPPSSWPQVYPGIPTDDYAPNWQDCEFLSLFVRYFRANAARQILE